MANLTVDIGNTLIKVAIFEKEELMKITSLDEWQYNDIKSFIAGNELDHIIVSSVRKDISLIISDLNNTGAKIIELSHKSCLPFKIDYLTPETLGIDRIAALLGGCRIKPNSDLLVIDIGTCITYDLLINNHFIGGNIAPGIQMRATAMHEYTQKLPYIEVEKTSKEIGQSTKEAINIGAFWGVIYEIKSIVSRYRVEYPKIECIITGGGADFLRDKLEKELDNIHYDRHILLRGLNSLPQFL